MIIGYMVSTLVQNRVTISKIDGIHMYGLSLRLSILMGTVQCKMDIPDTEPEIGNTRLE